ncbi:MAG: fibronectin type III domain-containing protein [Desulfobacteraceae bacterium]|jgi:hypothetical protein
MQIYAAASKWLVGLFCIIILGLTPNLQADCQVTLSWDPNSTTPDGYRLFQRESGSTYDYNDYSDVGQQTSYTVSGLTDDTIYHFVVRAYVGSEESGDSNEAVFNCGSGSAPSGGNPPSQPSTVTPNDGAMDVSLQPRLTTSAFYDPDSGDYHSQTRWQIFRLDNDACVYDVVSSSALTALTVPSLTLDSFTVYYWTVRYYDQNGNVSAPAPIADFTTLQSEDSEGGASASLSSGSSGGGSGGSGGGSLIGGCFISILSGLE